MTGLAGRVAIVTGAANGMGERAAHTLAARGATVVIADKDADRAPLVEKEIKAEGGDALAVVTDVSDEKQVRALVDTVVERFGRIDFLDNNAAALELTGQDPDVIGLDPAVFLGTMRGNVFAPFLCCKYVLPVMLERGGGSIVNMASVSGMAGELTLTAYGISKAAVIQLTRAVATQYGKHGIRCNAIAPAYVRTRNNEIYAPPELAGIYARNMATASVADPQDIADLVGYLASDESRLITGQVIPVDGGITGSSPIVADYRDWQAERG